MLNIIKVEKIGEFNPESQIVRIYLTDSEDKKFQHTDISILNEETLYINNINSYEWNIKVKGIEKIESIDTFFQD